ncbi:stress-inducible protein [Streptomyces carminius]|uniref:Stress-inducible protein n=1 Tax=Streptomyces carminius TaxID=2665496 RepID=A0A2M8LTP1_9ACTN|nr:universal stress protein [Streptomyces carminius]PJE95317.1 stress-inducible protein [Streptomyces carminius]
MVRTVTVGVDGSRESLAAADWAAREARRREVPLRLVHVREPDPFTLQDSGADSETRQHWAERIPREAADTLAGRYPGLEITTEQRTGNPSAELIDAAQEAEVLVIGSRGLGIVTGFLVGSVALSTVGRVGCPVVLVRAGEDGQEERDGREQAPAEAPEGDVVLGLELYRPCEELLEFAFDAAARRGAALRVVHGWNPPLVYGIDPIAVDPRLATDLAEESARVLKDTLRPWREKYPGVEVRAQAVIGRPARHLLEAAEDACLVVVGRRNRRSPLGFHIGPVAHGVMHHATVPVAVVPHD